MLRKQVGMQVQQIDSTHDLPRHSRRGSQSSLLLVGSEDAFNSEAAKRILGWHQFKVTDRASTLLEGLARLEFEPIDLVLVSLEFREEELSLFAFDAHRRGFSGLILHVASLPDARGPALGGSRGSADVRLGPRPREANVHGRAEGVFARSYSLSNQSLGLGPDNRIRVDGRPDPVYLTSKEQSVMIGVAEGYSNMQIARKLNCSEGSVKAVLQQLFGKLGVRKRAQIVRLAFASPLMQAQSGRRENIDETASHGPAMQSATHQGSGIPETPPSNQSSLVEVGDFVMETSKHRVWVRGKEAQLSAREFELFMVLIKHPNELLRHNDLAGTLSSGSRRVSRESLRALIQAVRGKIEPTSPPRYIVTQPFQGYRFIPSP
jgi:DNA-binding CsgD family transcriptional regulator/DNA-binding winged helix-turn-helix (wHTH) protein